jgi:hypothetical protein
LLNFFLERKWVEIHLYSPPQKIFSELLLSSKTDYPLHLYFEDKLLGKIERRYTNIYKSTDIEYTRCPVCKNAIIVRHEGYPHKILLDGDKCPYCGEKVLYRPPSPNQHVNKRFSRERVVIPWLFSGKTST